MGQAIFEQRAQQPLFLAVRGWTPMFQSEALLLVVFMARARKQFVSLRFVSFPK